MKYKLIFFLLISAASGLAQPFTDSLISSVEKGLTKQSVLSIGESIHTNSIYDQLKLEKVNGVSVAVINNYKIEWAKTYGVADNSNNTPLTTETLFQCASIGKMITAMAALRLVRENKIELDENVNNKLTSWKIEENEFTIKEKVTLRRLLCHAAGLLDDYGFEGYHPTDKIPGLIQILRHEPPANGKKKIKVEAIPGTVERYSGGGYVIVQQLIEDISHQSFSEFVTDNIFSPLGMSNTTYNFFPDTHLNKPIARGHDENGRIDKKRKYNIYPEMGAAGPWTTATDLAKLVIEIQKEFKGASELILNGALCKEMLTPQINFKGLGVHLKGAAKAEAFWHAGNNAGFIGLLYGTTDKGQGAVVLTNSDTGEDIALQIMTSVANTYHWPVMNTYVSRIVTQEEINSYKGNYQSKAGTIVTIGENENGLFIIPHLPKKEIPMYKISHNQFTLKDSPDFVTISFDKENGVTVGITISQKLGKVDRLKKVE